MDVDWIKVKKLLNQLYDSTDALEAAFPGRKFTLDGHLVGSIGEVVAAYIFDLDLTVASTKAHDAIARDGRQVEIKLTQAKSVALRHEPQHLIVLRRPKGGKVSVIYNGPGALVWELAGGMQSNGQRPIGVGKLRVLNSTIPDEQQLPVVRDAPI